MMMALGMFVFSLETLAYQEFQRQTEWRHGSTSRIGINPARQYLGRGDDSITLPGVLLPALAGTQLSLDTLRTMADTGKAWPLVEGTTRSAHQDWTHRAWYCRWRLRCAACRHCATAARRPTSSTCSTKWNRR